MLKSQSSGTYDKADSYALAQSFLTGTGETTAVMGLDSITHTGEDGTAVALPPTTFTMTMMNNRVLGTTQPALYRPRVIGIATEADAQVSVDYNPPECTQGSGGNITDADAPTNTMTCYPAYWAPPSEPDAIGLVQLLHGVAGRGDRRDRGQLRRAGLELHLPEHGCRLALRREPDDFQASTAPGTSTAAT